MTSRFANPELNRACGDVLDSLRNVIPFYNNHEIPLYGLGVLDGQYTEMNVSNKDYYNLDDVISSYKKANKGATTTILLTNYLKHIHKTIKDKKEREYSIYIIMISGQIDDEDKAKDMFFELCKFPVSFIIIGLKGKNSAVKFPSFLTKCSKFI